MEVTKVAKKITRYVDTIYRSCMHSPICKRVDGSLAVLFPRVDNADNDEAYDAETYRALEADRNYMTASKITYNSPTNIRRVFLTATGVYIGFYASFPNLQRKTNTSFNRKQLEYRGEKIDFTRDIVQRLGYNQKNMAYMQAKSINKDAKEPTYIEFSGDPLRVLIAPWVLANVEEIYMDWTVLAIPEVEKYFIGTQYAGENAQMTFLSGNYQGDMVDLSPNFINWAVHSLVRGNTDVDENGNRVCYDIHKRFPRLKYIGIISNLAKYVSTDGVCTFNNVITTNGEKAGKTWLVENKDRLKDSILLIGDMDKNTRDRAGKADLKNFVVRPNVYVFDRNILKGKVAAYLAGLEASILGDKYSGSSSDTPMEVTNDIEKMLLAIENKYGEQGIAEIANILNVANLSLSAPKKTLKMVFSGFTPPNRDRYLSAVGLTWEKLQ